MKRTAILGLLLSFASFGTSPLIVSAQKSSRSVRQQVDHDIRPATLRAITDGAGVLLRWKLQSETGIVGYNVYRVSGESKEKFNRSIVRGANILQHKDVVSLPEERQFFDPDGRVGQEYAIESLGVDGTGHIEVQSKAVSVASLESEAGVSSEVLRQANLSTDHDLQRSTPNLTPALSDLVAAYTPAADAAYQRVVASKAGAKIAVKQDGFYRVSAAELQAANFPVDGDSTKWRLFTNGVEQSIIVGANNSFIEFYGRGVDFPETDTRIYYLIPDTVPGKRISNRLVRAVPGNPTYRNFQITAEKKDRKEPSFELFNGDDENFLGALFDTGGTLIRFNLHGIDFSQPTATIKISLYGHSANSHHRVVPSINGFELPPMTQFGRVFYSESFLVPTEHLLEGQNELNLTSTVNGSYNLFNKVEVTYKRNYTSNSGKLSFYSPGFRKIDLDGFATPSVRIFDTTFDGNPVLLSGLNVEEGPAGYGVRIPGSRMMVGYAVEDSAVLQSPSVTANLPSTLHDASNGADMLIISHSAPAFMTASETWAGYRRSQAGGAMSTKVVDVADIFDEFNFGMVKADAIKSFLHRAYAGWAVRPKYVLLIGDASEDPRDYAGAGNFNLVPSRMTSYITDESYSDELLVDFDGDDAGELAIGRIPARTAAEIERAYNKMIAYETAQQSLARGILFAHDAPIGYDFAGLNQRLAQLVPQGTPMTNVSVTQANATAALITEFRRGNAIVNYSGHGALSFWSGSNLLAASHVTQLTNLQNPSVVSMMTCLSGRFGQRDRVSLAEVLLFSEVGGAAATWASTGSTTADSQLLMAERFFQKFNQAGPRRLGDMIRTAKADTPSGRDVKLSWAVLGDPAMRMP